MQAVQVMRRSVEEMLFLRGHFNGPGSANWVYKSHGFIVYVKSSEQDEFEREMRRRQIQVQQRR